MGIYYGGIDDCGHGDHAFHDPVSTCDGIKPEPGMEPDDIQCFVVTLYTASDVDCGGDLCAACSTLPGLELLCVPPTTYSGIAFRILGESDFEECE